MGPRTWTPSLLEVQQGSPVSQRLGFPKTSALIADGSIEVPKRIMLGGKQSTL